MLQFNYIQSKVADNRALMFHLSTNYMLGSLKGEAKQEVSLKHYAT